MTSENKSLHVVPLRDRWIVEKDDGTSVADAADRDEAIRLAREVAPGEGASGIAVHAPDGELETTLPVDDDAG